MNNVQTANKYVPDYLVTPGDVLEDYLGYAGIAPGIVVDRLQHDKALPMSWGNDLKINKHPFSFQNLFESLV